MSGLVALGRHAGPFLDDPVHVVHVDPDEVTGDLSAMYEVISDQLDRHGQLLVICPEQLGEGPRRAIALVRAALGGPPILVHVTRLPPLAADVMITLLAALGRHLDDAAVLAAAVPMVEEQIVRFTWLASVSGLSEPAPTVAQHARSVLPGASWLVRSWPEPVVERFDEETTFPVPTTSREVGVALADSGGDRSWIDPMVGARISRPASIEVDPPPDTAEWWGCEQVTQLVLYPREVELLLSAVQGRLDPGLCRWCHQMVGSRVCPFCRLSRTGTLRIETEHSGQPSPTEDDGVDIVAEPTVWSSAATDDSQTVFDLESARQ